MRNKDLEVPQADKFDVAHTGAGVALSVAAGITSLAVGIPLMGIPELFNFIVSPSLGLRRDRWMKKVAEIIEEIQRKQASAVEELRNNEEFQTLLIQASQIAIKTHLEEKQNLLKTAVLNFIESKADFDVSSSYLNIIDGLQMIHITLLIRFEGLTSMTEFVNKTEFYRFLSKELIPLPEQAYLELLIVDLWRVGLITNEHRTEGTAGAVLGEPYYSYVLSPFGMKFMKFLRAV